MGLTHREPRTLPPGQHRSEEFPRYGTHLFLPVPDLSRLDAIAIGGAVTRPVTAPLADLAAMPRRDVIADLHCVAGWSVQGLHWGGVPFRAFYDAVIAPVAEPGVTHIRFGGIDGFHAVLTIEDALTDEVMVADHLDGQPLGGQHGGPARIVFPSRYAYKSTKHLATIDVHTSEPAEDHANDLIYAGLRLVKAHPRGRVALEERHRHLPGWLVRGPYYRVLHPAFGALCKLGDRRTERRPDPAGH